MKTKYFIIKIIVIYIFIISNSISKESVYLTKAIDLFKKKEFEKSKFLFEKDLVFNPKSENSYLYLAKIFDAQENKDEQEINLNSVLLLNPQNEEAVYMLTILKIEQSDYNEANKLIEKFILVCKSFCSKKKEIDKKMNKLIPDNAKKKN